MAAHLALAIEENLRRGFSVQEARRQALIQFGGIALAKENRRDRDYQRNDGQTVLARRDSHRQAI